MLFLSALSGGESSEDKKKNNDTKKEENTKEWGSLDLLAGFSAFALVIGVIYGIILGQSVRKNKIKIEKFYFFFN